MKDESVDFRLRINDGPEQTLRTRRGIYERAAGAAMRDEGRRCGSCLMVLKYLMLVEEISNTEIEEAFWWLQRWVSGSLGDPDWDESWLEKVHDVETAFEIISGIVGNRLSVGRPLWRYLSLPEAAVSELERTKRLIPHSSTIQSFTTSRKLVLRIAEELHYGTKGVPIIISAAAPARLVLFGMRDVRKSKLWAAKQALLPLQDWAHQDEVMVKVTEPLPLLRVERLEELAQLDF